MARGCRRSVRQRNRIATAGLRRIRTLFWQGDSRYEEDDDEETSSSSESDEEPETRSNPSRPASSDAAAVLLQQLEKRFRMRKVHDSPHVYILEDFLSEAELAYFRGKLSSHKFEKSFVDDPTDNTSCTMEEQRTSTFCSLGKQQDAKVAHVEGRAAELVGTSVERLEPLQLVQYEEGQFFGIHHDLGTLYDDGSVELPPKQFYCKRRIVTIFAYLNDVPNGGCTYFPSLQDGKGLRIQPKRGRAVMFCNIGPEGLPDPRTVHAGEPVLPCPKKEDEEHKTDESPGERDPTVNVLPCHKEEDQKNKTDESPGERAPNVNVLPSHKEEDQKNKVDETPGEGALNVNVLPCVKEEDEENKVNESRGERVQNVKYGLNIWVCEK